MSDETPPFIRPLGDTTLSPYDLMEIGAKLMNALATTELLGHTAPGHSLEYTSGEHFIRDVIAWTSGRKHLAPGCEERVRAFVVDSGWTRYALTQASRGLGRADTEAAS